jgi:hypothetical protein
VRAALQEVDEEQRPGCRVVQQRTFVLEKVYNELYSQLPDARAMFGEKDTCQMLGGQAGYWVRGSFGNGQFGHYLFEDFAENGQVMRKRHESGDHIFTKTQAEDKFECLVQMNGGEKQRAEAKMARLSPAAMMDLATKLSVPITYHTAAYGAGGGSFVSPSCTEADRSLPRHGTEADPLFFACRPSWHGSIFSPSWHGGRSIVAPSRRAEAGPFFACHPSWHGSIISPSWHGGRVIVFPSRRGGG